MSYTTVSGPMFDGRASAALKEGGEHSASSVAKLGASMVRTNLNHVLRKQTPYYRPQVSDVKVSAYHTKVTDNAVIYGHWLEGTGRRNSSTRFKGYFTFRRTTAELDMRAKDIVQGVMRPYIQMMNH
jgi:hypothetical protein